MTGLNVRNDRRNQRPVDRPVVYWSERRGTWWTGVGRRCPACNGALYAVPPVAETRHGVTPGRIACLLCGREAADVLDVRPPVLTAADLAPAPRGRPPKDEDAAPPKRTRKLCPDCGVVRLSQRAVRCLDCSRRRREERAMTTRAVLALSDGRPWSAVALCELLGATPGTLRHVIRKARLRGCVIRRAARRSYVLEMAS